MYFRRNELYTYFGLKENSFILLFTEWIKFRDPRRTLSAEKRSNLKNELVIGNALRHFFLFE